MSKGGKKKKGGGGERVNSSVECREISRQRSRGRGTTHGWRDSSHNGFFLSYFQTTIGFQQEGWWPKAEIYVASATRGDELCLADFDFGRNFCWTATAASRLMALPLKGNRRRHPACFPSRVYPEAAASFRHCGLAGRKARRHFRLSWSSGQRSTRDKWAQRRAHAATTG